MTSKGVGIPVKLLHESEGHVITVRASSACCASCILGGGKALLRHTMHGPKGSRQRWCAPKTLETV